MSKLIPGMFSQNVILLKKNKENFEPNKKGQQTNRQSQELLRRYLQPSQPNQLKANKSCRKLNDQNKELNLQTEKLKSDNRRLKERIRHLQKQITNKQQMIIQNEEYIQQLQQELCLEKNKLKKQKIQMRALLNADNEKQKQSETLKKELISKIEYYERIIKQTVLFLMNMHSITQNLKQQLNQKEKLEFQMVSFTQYLYPLCEQWGIQKELGHITDLNSQQIQQKHEQQSISFIKQFEQQCIYQANSDYNQTKENHLNFKKGAHIKILKKNQGSELWIGECEERIGFFDWNVLLK